jgi:hypothetical protein
MTPVRQEVPSLRSNGGAGMDTADGEMRCGACGVAVSRLKRPK